MKAELRRESLFKVFHFFGGSGGGGLGFARGHARVGRSTARFRTLGSVDVNPAATDDFTRLVGVKATTLDLFTRVQFERFHGTAPPDDWREATHHDIREAAQFEDPDVVFLSPPCKGLSGLLSGRNAKSAKYQALNQLVLRSFELMMAAWGHNPPAFLLIENVPRIQSRGRAMLDEITAALHAAGYSTVESTHDCGELGGLGQSRKRFLLVARHREKVPPFLYAPPRQALRSVGEVVGALPVPHGVATGHPMHQVPRLTWKTWVRLGLIEPGKDWRSLKTLDWRSLRLVREGYPHAVPDPEVREGRHNNVYRVVRWADHSPAVTGGAGPSSGGLCLNDPRPPRDLGRYCPYGVLRWDRPMGTVTGEAAPGAGVYSVADPRPAREPGRSGPYGVLRWDEAAGAVVGHASHDNSRVSVADPRPLPADHDQPDPVPLIRTLWGGWNRPLTTAELGLIQGFPIDFIFSGRSHTACRERVGNSVPPPAAEAIASTMLHTLLLAAQGTAFQLSALPIWVHPLAIALSMDRPHPELSA